MSTQRVVNIIGYERIKNSANGNPRYRLFMRYSSYETAPDAALGYSLNNGNLPADDVTLTLNGRGKVTHVTLSDGTRV